MPGSGYLDIHFEVEGQREIVRRLGTFGHNVKDLSPAWEQIGKDLLADNAQNFAQEGGVFGKGGWAQWSPLALSTQRERARLGYGAAHPILVREGDLKASLTVRGAAGNIFRVRPDGVEVGTAMPYAVYHHSTAPRKRLPRRVLVGITPQRAGWAGQAGSVVDRLNKELQRQIALAGLHG